MKKVIIIGCPGSGKSTFARALQKATGLPLFHLDLLYHKPDKTTYTKQEFDEALGRILEGGQWIIDGNYARTLPVRLAQCDTVFWLDYPLDVCLQGIQARRGKTRSDMPWIETEHDEEFMEFVKNFHKTARPEIESLLQETAKQGKKEIVVFRSREMAAEYLRGTGADETPSGRSGLHG